MNNKIRILLFALLVYVFSSCSKNSDTTSNTTPPPGSTTPALTSGAATAVTINSAVCNGSITSDGGSAITERGICYNTTGNPTTADTKITSGSGTGDFSASLTGLTDNTIYHYRAYCINANGTYYSGDATFHTLQIFTLGESYGGGIIFYIDNTNQHGLIVAPVATEFSVIWGCSVNLSNCNDTIIGTGSSNTIAIVSQCSTSDVAARVCYDLVYGGYNDWFLPSKHELNEMYVQRTLIGDLHTNETYWSSSQYNGPYSWKQDFNNGLQQISGKGAGYRVRAVRKF